MRALFLATQTMTATQGICRKIWAQAEGFRANGVETDFCCLKEIDDKFYYVINDNPICCVGSGKLSIIMMRCNFNAIYRHIIYNHIELLYIRYVHIANPFFIRFLKKLKNCGIRIYMEIPTYPYDSEYTNSNGRIKCLLAIENIYRKQFRKCIDKIVTVQEYNSILNIPTIKISNGINLKDIPLRSPKRHKGYVFIGVANIELWHGYDRLIEGIGNYYKNGGQEDIHFYIVGKKDSAEKDYINVSQEYNIQERIHLEGPKRGRELDKYFDNADLAIGSLGFHRIGLKEGKSLKCMEYAARGIPFVYSNINMDFDDKDYIVRVASDDSPIDVEMILSFIKGIKRDPLTIRNSIGNKATWEYQMSLIVSDFNNNYNL